MTARFPTHIPMPDGFTWAPRNHLDTLPTGLFLFGEEVASLLDRVDGSWFAYLRISGEAFAMPAKRGCTSFEAGQRGGAMGFAPRA
ncbi:hypothetical protein GCM10027214_06080 [Stenotrophomonas tumulicola]